MPIHLEAPASPEFIRITAKTTGLPANMIPIGSVGRVIGRGDIDKSQPVSEEGIGPLVSADIVGHGERIFNTKDTELITEEEYFLGALRGRL